MFFDRGFGLSKNKLFELINHVFQIEKTGLSNDVSKAFGTLGFSLEKPGVFFYQETYFIKKPCLTNR